MKKSDLYGEWARVLDMCEGTKVDPVDCWKFNGEVKNRCISLDSFGKYEFAVAILEDKPVFIGDKVYANNCTSPLTVEGSSKQLGYISVGNCVNYDISILSWNPPNKTFLLNGEELPCPDNNKGGYQISLLSGRHYFSDFHDAQKVANAFDKLLSENTK